MADKKTGPKRVFSLYEWPIMPTGQYSVMIDEQPIGPIGHPLTKAEAECIIRWMKENMAEVLTMWMTKLITLYRRGDEAKEATEEAGSDGERSDRPAVGDADV